MSIGAPRTCVTTLYNAPFARIGDFCRASLVDYADRHGYDAVHSSGVEIDRPISWQKLLLVESLFDAGYEFVFWVDADAIVTDPSRAVLDVVRPGKDLYLVRHKIHGRYCANMGVFLLRNSGWSRKLLRDLGALEQYNDHPWWETAALKHLLHRDLFADKGITNPNGPWLDESRVEWLDDDWNHLRYVSDGKRPVIRHFAGCVAKKRMKRMIFNCRPLSQAWRRWTTRWAPMEESRFPAMVALPRRVELPRAALSAERRAA
jgi:hypothetical protein